MPQRVATGWHHPPRAMCSRSYHTRAHFTEWIFSTVQWGSQHPPDRVDARLGVTHSGHWEQGLAPETVPAGTAIITLTGLTRRRPAHSRQMSKFFLFHLAPGARVPGPEDAGAWGCREEPRPQDTQLRASGTRWVCTILLAPRTGCFQGTV